MTQIHQFRFPKTMKKRVVQYVAIFAVLMIFWVSIVLKGDERKYTYVSTCLENSSLMRFFNLEGTTKINQNFSTLSPLLKNFTVEKYAEERFSNGKPLSSVRVLCWVMTQPKNHQTRVKAIIDTWGKRCDKLIFISSEEDPSLKIIGFNMTEGRDVLWGKTKEAFKYIHKHYLNDTEWFLKADDDTYVIMENLRHLLRGFNASRPLWFGHRFKKFTKQGYMSGGAGYVLSREAVKRFVEQAIPNPKICREGPKGAEDAEMGKCLDKVNVEAMDSRDEMNRGRFFPMVPDNHLVASKFIKPSHWYWNYTFYKEKEGVECCSETAISFHYISDVKMIELEYLIYHLRVVDS